MQTLKLEGEDKKIGGIYYFLPDPISVETVRNEIEKELGEKQKSNYKTTQILIQIQVLTNKQKETNQNKTPTDPPPSTNAHAEWIMRNQP